MWDIPLKSVRYRTNACGNAQKFDIGEDERIFVRRKFGGCLAFVLSLFAERDKKIDNGREKEGQSACH